MGKTVALEGRALDWARDRFREYYGRAVIPAPVALEEREFASFPFTTELFMRRHASFPGPGEFRRYLVDESPRHVYYSSAYYEHPDHPTMAGKGWLGADLIFDLDADHLREAEGLDYPGQLRKVREKAISLYDDFLLGDLGVDPGSAQLVFSGGRGYHVHVRDERFRSLNSPERREIVDYVLGTGIEASRAILEVRESSESGALELSGSYGPGGGPRDRGARELRRSFKRLAPRDAPGWPGRISRSLDRTLARWIAEGTDTASADLQRWGVPKPKARRLAKRLVEEGKAELIRAQGTLEVFHDDPPEELLEVVLRRATIEVQGETDAPVTTDIHRLIRLPGSLHGGTGFRVVPIDRGALDRFDPFRDALPFVGNGRTEVRLEADVDYPFADPVRGPAGAVLTLPDPVALFLTLRGEAGLPAGAER